MADSTLLDLALILTGLATGAILVHALVGYFAPRRPRHTGPRR